MDFFTSALPFPFLREVSFMGKKLSVLSSMFASGVVAFYVTLLSLGKPKTGEEAQSNFWVSMSVALLVFLFPLGLVWLLDKFGNQEAWKVGLLVFVAMVLCAAIRVLL